MIKCGVCGSENEAAALFCGTCGSALTPAQAQEIVDEATKPEVLGTTPDDTVVPGQGGARRDLGTGAQADTTAIPTGGPVTGADPGIVDDDIASGKPTIVCSVCGTINDATRTYCRKCANELKPAAPPPPPPPPAPVARKISPVAIGLGAAAVVVAIALIGVLAFGGKPGPTLKPTAQASLPLATSAPTAAATTLPTPTARAFTEGARAGLVAFARCSGGSCAIYTIKADGKSKSVRITSTSPSASDPSLSYDGLKVVYSVKPGLRIVTVKTKSFVEHSTGLGDSGAAFSPNGKQLTFAGFRARDNNGTDLEIRIDGVSSGSSSPLTVNDAVDTQPVFTPDGKSIVFVEGEGDQAELKMVDIASKAITDLTTDAFEDRDPSVSPDGTEVVFASKRGGTGGFDLFVLNLATQEITQVTSAKGDERHPAFSPGGRYIVFSGGNAGSEDLFILDRTTNKAVTLTTGPSSDITPTWH